MLPHGTASGSNQLIRSITVTLSAATPKILRINILWIFTLITTLDVVLARSTVLLLLIIIIILVFCEGAIVAVGAA